SKLAVLRKILWNLDFQLVFEGVPYHTRSGRRVVRSLDIKMVHADICPDPPEPDVRPIHFDSAIPVQHGVTRLSNHVRHRATPAIEFTAKSPRGGHLGGGMRGAAAARSRRAWRSSRSVPAASPVVLGMSADPRVGYKMVTLGEIESGKVGATRQ